MKNLSLFVSAFALLASPASAQTINCGTLPSCDSLGYTDTVAQCPKSVNGEDLAVKCPFDTLKGKCIYEAAIGQIGYFTKAPNANSGWLLCDGKTYSNSTYPQLAVRIGTQFGGTSGNTFNVPNYQGYFLRVYGTPSSSYGKVGNTNLTTPQKEGIPNIYGQLGPFDDSLAVSTPVATGPFSVAKGYNMDLDSSGDGKANSNKNGTRMTFNANTCSTVYGASDGVTPPNMAVYAYIYAGKVVK